MRYRRGWDAHSGSLEKGHLYHWGIQQLPGLRPSQGVFNCFNCRPRHPMAAPKLVIKHKLASSEPRQTRMCGLHKTNSNKSVKSISGSPQIVYHGGVIFKGNGIGIISQSAKSMSKRGILSASASQWQISRPCSSLFPCVISIASFQSNKHEISVVVVVLLVLNLDSLSLKSERRGPCESCDQWHHPKEKGSKALCNLRQMSNNPFQRPCPHGWGEMHCCQQITPPICMKNPDISNSDH